MNAISCHAFGGCLREAGNQASAENFFFYLGERREIYAPERPEAPCVRLQCGSPLGQCNVPVGQGSAAPDYPLKPPYARATRPHPVRKIKALDSIWGRGGQMLMGPEGPKSLLSKLFLTLVLQEARCIPVMTLICLFGASPFSLRYLGPSQSEVRF